MSIIACVFYKSVLFFLLKEAHFIPPRYGLAARCASRGFDQPSQHRKNGLSTGEKANLTSLISKFTGIAFENRLQTYFSAEAMQCYTLLIEIEELFFFVQ